MEKAAGAMQSRPAPDFDRLCAEMLQNPREAIQRGKDFLNQACPDPLTQARIYNLLCYIAASELKRSGVEAAYHGHEAVRLAREVAGLDGQQLLFDSLVNLGVASERIGEYERSVDAYREALQMPLDWLGRRGVEEAVLTNLGRAHFYQGDYGNALVIFDQAGILASDRSDPGGQELVRSWRGMCYLKFEDLDMANYFIAPANSVVREPGVAPSIRARLLGNIATLKLLQSQEEEAEAYAQSLLALAGEIDDKVGQVQSRMVLACCARSKRLVQEAVDLSHQAAQIAFAYRYVPLLQELSWLMGYLYKQRRG